MPKRKAEPRCKAEPMCKVIRDCRDYRKDYSLPVATAKALYEAGKLSWDVTNKAYCTPNSNDPKIGLE